MAAADGSFRTVLALADGSLMLEDARPRWGLWNRCCASAPRLLAATARALSPDGVTGDWLPLGTLVRLQDSRTALPALRSQALCADRNQSLLIASISASSESTSQPRCPRILREPS